jgi:DNA-binding CsgD family transcriptional regulator
MVTLRHIESAPISPAVLRTYEQVVDAVGSEMFAERAARAVQRLTHVDRLYLFDLSSELRSVRSFVQFHEPDKPPVEHRTYVRHYLPTDPIQRAIGLSLQASGMIQIRVEPRDILASGYRRLLEHAGIRERVSFLRRIESGWQCMTVARKARTGVFEEHDLVLLGSIARLLMPLIERNRALSGCIPQASRDAISEIESRFCRLFPSLTTRERQTCARAAVGMTAGGAALDLGIALSSVLTYRKRAYQRLGVTSACELARLVMR